MNYRQEIDRLYHIEYGNRVEVIGRFSLVFVAAWAFSDYRHSTISLWWAGGFYLTHLCYFVILRSRPEDATAFDLTISSIGLISIMIAFVWLPTSLIGDPDMTVNLPAAATFGTMLIFLVRRADTMLWLVLAQLLMVTVAICAVLVATLPNVPGHGARFVIGLSGAALCGYFSQAILAHRKQRLEHAAATLRSVQAQKMEAIGQLVGGVAHDFNNILTALSGNLELYDVVPDLIERDQLVREARESSGRAAMLIQQLLAYSRQTHLEIRYHDLALVFAQTQALCRRLLPRSIAVTFETPTAPVMIEIDDNQLINAKDALEGAGSVVVRHSVITLRRTETDIAGYPAEPGTYVEISVIDDGPGLPPAVLARATEPFFTTKPIGKGSGLGLSMVEGFARHSGGGLAISSSPEGTHVAIYLPFDPKRPSDSGHQLHTKDD